MRKLDAVSRPTRHLGLKQRACLDQADRVNGCYICHTEHAKRPRFHRGYTAVSPAVMAAVRSVTPDEARDRLVDEGVALKPPTFEVAPSRPTVASQTLNAPVCALGTSSPSGFSESSGTAVTAA